MQAKNRVPLVFRYRFAAERAIGTENRYLSRIWASSSALKPEALICRNHELPEQDVNVCDYSIAQLFEFAWLCVMVKHIVHIRDAHASL
jgi:hypothetical protein